MALVEPAEAGAAFPGIDWLTLGISVIVIALGRSNDSDIYPTKKKREKLDSGTLHASGGSRARSMSLLGSGQCSLSRTSFPLGFVYGANMRAEPVAGQAGMS
jgi:hypothetical protein